MCRLIGITGCDKLEQNVLTNIWSEFFGLAKNGCVPKTVESGHNDGYGVVGFKDGVVAVYYRNFLPPHEDKNLPQVLKMLSEQKLDLAVGHLRKATKGETSVTNNQPFVKENFAFATNGTVHYENLEPGESDSKQLFANLLSAQDLENELNQLNDLEYTSATFVLTDGLKLTAGRWFNQDNEFAKKLDYNSYYTLYRTTGEGYEIISSELTSTFGSLSAQSKLMDNYTIYIAG